MEEVEGGNGRGDGEVIDGWSYRNIWIYFLKIIVTIIIVG